jgi:hypothetical protein
VSNVTLAMVGSQIPYVPQPWVLDYVRWCRVKLGLEIWDIDVLAVEYPNPDNPNSGGTNAFSAQYLQSTIRLRAETIYHEDCSAKVLILHELIHLLFAPLHTMADHFIGFAGETVQERLQALWVDAQEPQVVRLSYALYEILEPAWQQYKREQRKAARTQKARERADAA